MNLLLLLLLACFLPTGTQAGKIIGGHETRPHSRPYMACLKFSKHQPGCFCVGFLIREDFVLTTATCYHHSITIVLGAHNIRKSENSQQVIRVSKTFLHHNYNDKTYSNNIMLLKLVRKAMLTSDVKLLSLPSPGIQVKSGQVCSVAGWGRTSVYNETSPDTLREVEVIMQDDNECQFYFKHYIKDTQLCAGHPEQSKDFFEGDYGTPLVCNNVAQGIASYGDPCGAPPAVYTKVSSFLPWIKETMQRAPGS